MFPEETEGTHMSNNKVSFDDEVKKTMADMLEHGLSADEIFE